jgi:serine/threonine-protein kinase RsbW
VVRDMTGLPVVVTLPPHPTYLFVARTVTAGLAARTQLPFESVEDLRIAVTEACGRLIAVDRGANRMRLELEPGRDALTVRVSVDVDGVEWPAEETHASTSWQLIEGLCDEAHDELICGQPATVMKMRAGEP